MTDKIIALLRPHGIHLRASPSYAGVVNIAVHIDAIKYTFYVSFPGQIFKKLTKIVYFVRALRITSSIRVSENSLASDLVCSPKPVVN